MVLMKAPLELLWIQIFYLLVILLIAMNSAHRIQLTPYNRFLTRIRWCFGLIPEPGWWRYSISMNLSYCQRNSQPFISILVRTFTPKWVWKDLWVFVWSGLKISASPPSFLFLLMPIQQELLSWKGSCLYGCLINFSLLRPGKPATKDHVTAHTIQGIAASFVNAEDVSVHNMHKAERRTSLLHVFTLHHYFISASREEWQFGLSVLQILFPKWDCSNYLAP